MCYHTHDDTLRRFVTLNAIVCFQVVHKRLMAVLRHLIPGSAGQVGGGGAIWFPARDIPTESLIVGALEAAFWEMVRIEAIANDL